MGLYNSHSVIEERASMSNRFRLVAIGGIALLLLVVGAGLVLGPLASRMPWASAPPAVDTTTTPGIALSGYDAVAYFTQSKPVEGRAEFSLRHKQAEWRFSSMANRDAFAAMPEKYAPQYGGHCAWAVANGYTAKGDPLAWKIRGGRLFLNYDLAIQKQWEEDIPGNITKSDANWPKLLSGG